jgi:CubicO group peptidase (beta-lactamase class C family)
VHRLLLNRIVIITALLCLVLPFSALAQEDGDTYTHPDGLYSVPIPTNWRAEEFDGYALLASPDDGIQLYVVVIETDDGTAAVDEAWELVRPGFDPGEGTIQEVEGAVIAPLDKVVVVNYPPADGTIYQGVAQITEGISYVILVDAQLIDLQQRAAQLNIFNTGFTITALERADLTGIEPLPVTGEMIAELEAFIVDVLERAEIPGAAVAVVYQGEIVYADGFGVLEQGGSDPVTAETLMMIGSSTKTMTTLAMATLVDDGLMDWETPVVDVLPTFEVANPALTEQITVENLVCACSGVPRRDFEIIFNYDELSAEDIVESLATFEFFTDFGEAFQYSNQMVAAGGYVAALAAGVDYGYLYDGYLAMMQERILDPIGMDASTFSFDAVQAGGRYATPHSINLNAEYDPISLNYEGFVTPVAPAGALWSNVLDMGAYLITLLNDGVTPDGTRIVSVDNLRYTWQPQVPIGAETSYGLGWILDTYKGLPLISHGGNTIGFTSEMTMLPTADVGVVVLTNAQGTNLISEAIRTRLFELIFELESEADELVSFGLDMTAEAFAELNIAESVDEEAVTPFLGAYSHAALGALSLDLVDGALFADVGEFRTELRPLLNDEGETRLYLVYGAPLAGVEVRLLEDDDGILTVVVGSGVTEYIFTPVE